MVVKFISFVYFEGYILGFTEYGECWKFEIRSGYPIWTMLCDGPST